MIVLAPKNLCSGCTACFCACSFGAIQMEPDEEGFLYPQINEKLCTQCGLCEKSCPSLVLNSRREPLDVYAAINTDHAVRMESSSGGMFTVFAKEIFKKHGIVYGAGWNEYFCVVHKAARCESELEDFRGSKYVQSNLGIVFQSIQRELLIGQKVLFSGTPCQGAGLRRFLGRENPNLLIVDCICHAIPSPRVFAAYKNELEKKYQSKTEKFSFRRKTHGWSRYAIQVKFANQKEYFCISSKDPYMQGFLGELFSRPSCYECMYREGRSCADVTMADYWGVVQRFPDMDDDKGTSLILIWTEKGKSFFEQSVDSLKHTNGQIRIQNSNYDDVKRTNTSIFRNPVPHKNRDLFFYYLQKRSGSFQVKQLLQPTIFQRVYNKLERIVYVSRQGIKDVFKKLQCL